MVRACSANVGVEDVRILLVQNSLNITLNAIMKMCRRVSESELFSGPTFADRDNLLMRKPQDQPINK